MNWEAVYVSEEDFYGLIKHNKPIYAKHMNLKSNAGVELRTESGKKIDAIYDAHLESIRQLMTDNPYYSSLPNRDLALYNDHLLNPNINTVIVDGFFGTGKTSILSAHLVNGLKKELECGEGIPQVYLSKPHVPVGNGYGHLPGDLHDKTLEEFKSYTQYFDRFGGPGFADYLMCYQNEEKTKHIKQKQLVEPMLHILVFEYLRGRDIDRGWVVLDETQNANEKEMATLISRIHDKAKLVIIGDTTSTQIDRKGNNPEQNGLSFVKNIYKNKKYAGYVELQSLSHILRGKRVVDLCSYLKKNN